MIIGTGDIGSDIAKLLSALAMRVTGIRRTPAPAASFDMVLGIESIESVLADADWLIFACPLTEETRGLLDHARLQRLKPGARLVNIARGEIVEEPALIEVVRSGSLGGAYLDVFAHEPLPFESPLWDLPSVLISPHSAGNSTNHQQNVIELFQRNLIRLALGHSLINEWKPCNNS